MTTHDLAPFVTTFFTRHLPTERNASPHTIAAYRDTLKLLLRFLAASMHRSAAALHVEDLTPDRILAFLDDLETVRRNTIRTRNARLAAIHSFFRYVLDSEPALALPCQRVLAIPVKKAPRPVLGYLSDTELAHVLAQIDRSTQVGERDYLLVALLYDTGARIQELLDLAPCDVRFAPPPFVRLFGKGRRERLTPLLPQTAALHREVAPDVDLRGLHVGVTKEVLDGNERDVRLEEMHRLGVAERVRTRRVRRAGEETYPWDSACGPVAKAPDKPPTPYRLLASPRLY